MSNVLIILGMHRSGTSLLANYLATGGLHIGTDLLGTDWSNPAGHFENRAFLKFHNDVLKVHGQDFKVGSPVKWMLTETHFNEARALVMTHSTNNPWGWKDPRTCLFLDFWRNVLTTPKYIAIYRHYVPVINSLMTRDFYQFRRTQQRLFRPFSLVYFRYKYNHLVRTYLKTWIHYNKQILAELEKYPADLILLRFDDLTRSNNIPYPVLDKWGIELNRVPTIDARDVQALHAIDFDPDFEPKLFETAEQIWSALKSKTYSSQPESDS